VTLVKDFTAALKSAKRMPLDEAIELDCVKVYRGAAPSLRFGLA
jgi:hypothetical protein